MMQEFPTEKDRTGKHPDFGWGGWGVVGVWSRKRSKRDSVTV